MRKNSKRVAQILCALSVSAVASQVLANSGIQLPLSQYQAGQEQTTPVTNGGFEVDGVGNLATPTGWIRTGTEMFVDPVYTAPPLNPAAIGSYSAQTRGAGANAYDQPITGLVTGKNYVLSAYVWNSGQYDVSGGAAGDIATVKVVDPGNSFNNIAMVLEGNGSNAQSSASGRLMYLLFNQADIASWSGVNVQIISETGTLGGTPPNPWAQYDNVAVTPAENFVAQKWLSNVSGNWTDDSKWLGGVNPSAQNSTFVSSKHAIASFTNGITSNQTISVNAARTLAIMNFDNAGASYTIAGPSAITLDITTDGFGTPQGRAEINVLSGSHTVSAQLNLARDTRFNVSSALGSLTLSGTINANGRVITKLGTGLVTVNNMRSLGLAVQEGTFRIAPNSLAAGVSKNTTLSVASAAKLDLTNNKLITASAVGTQTAGIYNGVQGLVQSGYGSGVFDGTTGIITSQTDATNGSGLTTIGVSTGAAARFLGPTDTDLWAGQTINGNSTMVMYTYIGDANLDGFLDSTDYFYIDNGVSTPGADGFTNGDFNYDGVIDATDYFYIDNNIALSLPVIYTSGGSELLIGVTAVPEPASLSIVAFISYSVCRRRRRIPTW